MMYNLWPYMATPVINYFQKDTANKELTCRKSRQRFSSQLQPLARQIIKSFFPFYSIFFISLF